MKKDEITILVNDDEPSNIQVFIKLLGVSDEYKILSSVNSELALQIAHQALPDIIITDWEMPHMNGIELILELKKKEATKDIPVIVATGVKITSKDLKIAMESGAYDFIRKPIDELELIARITSAIRFVQYYQAKIEFEKIVARVQNEKNKMEIELRKKELVSKTMELLKVNQLYEKFSRDLEAIECSKNKTDCQVYCFAQDHAREIIKSSNDQIWGELQMNFENIHDNFYRNVTARFPNLTQNERRLCAYLRLNLSTKEISSMTLQSLRSIEIARTRLREKLGLKGLDEDLHTFMLKF